MAAAYGCLPHEALLFAQVQPPGLLRIADGKTGARQSLALPPAWIERWSLRRKRLPAFNAERSHRDVGALMGQAFRRAGATFQPYDLRHAWAVRVIHNPKISPSLAPGRSMAVTAMRPRRCCLIQPRRWIQNQSSAFIRRARQPPAHSRDGPDAGRQAGATGLPAQLSARQ